jgi:thymidylate synthase (FAD)
MATDIQLRSDFDFMLISTMGGDEQIARAAWASTNPDDLAKQAEDAKDPKKVTGLINYLMKQRHGSPFEHSAMTFAISCPIFVFREWHRHRVGWSYNESSARYSKLRPVFYVPTIDRPTIKIKEEDWKASRPKFTVPYGVEERASACELASNLTKSYRLAYEMYEKNLSLDVDPGVARACLPVGIYSTCWMTCNPRSLMHFLSLRTHEPGAKFVSYPLYEIEAAARLVEQVFEKHWPATYKAFVENGRVAP